MSSGGRPTVTVRPTLRCLRDLGIKVPFIDEPLSELDHPVIRSAQQVPERVAAYAAERIFSLTDRVWFKDRAGQWRSAVTQLLSGDASPEDAPDSWWIGAASLRRDGSTAEPYDSWLRWAQSQGSKQHPETDAWLPTQDDWARWVLERAVAEERELTTIVPQLIAMSLRGRRGFTAERGGFRFHLEARATDPSEVYLALAAVGVPHRDFANRLAAVLDSVPGVQQSDWFPEPPASWPFQAASGAVVWSTLLPPQVQAQMLDDYPDDLEAAEYE